MLDESETVRLEEMKSLRGEILPQTVLLLHSVLHNTGQFKPVSASAARWRYSPPKNEYLAVSCFYFNHLAGKIMPIFLFISSQFPCFKPYLYENWWNWRWKLWFGGVVLSAVRWGLKLNWQHWFLSECSCGSEMERFQWEHLNILAFFIYWNYKMMVHIKKN